MSRPRSKPHRRTATPDIGADEILRQLKMILSRDPLARKEVEGILRASKRRAVSANDISLAEEGRLTRPRERPGMFAGWRAKKDTSYGESEDNPMNTDEEEKGSLLGGGTSRRGTSLLNSSLPIRDLVAANDSGDEGFSPFTLVAMPVALVLAIIWGVGKLT
ncbi:hypothetical protein T439DRAFT_357184 [Meredithblackwellia eburnea MCA 4105]